MVTPPIWIRWSTTENHTKPMVFDPLRLRLDRFEGLGQLRGASAAPMLAILLPRSKGILRPSDRWQCA